MLVSSVKCVIFFPAVVRLLQWEQQINSIQPHVVDTDKQAKWQRTR